MVRHGSTMWWATSNAWDRKSGGVSGYRMPPLGNRSPVASDSSMPSQNVGIAHCASASPVEIRSDRDPRRHAPRMPSHSPIVTASTVDVPVSSTVGHSRSPISSSTGLL
jgi:hypothetical protein